jgi:hypothetical protein
MVASTGFLETHYMLYKEYQATAVCMRLRAVVCPAKQGLKLTAPELGTPSHE